MRGIDIKSGLFLSLFIFIFIVSASVGALTINSNQFVFTTGNIYPNTDKYWFDIGDNYKHDFATIKGNNEIGIFSFSNEDIQEVINGKYYAVSIGLGLTMFDGDTAAGNTDYNDLVLSLGNSTKTLAFDQFYLNGFPQEKKVTIEYDFKITDDYLAASLTGLVQDSNGAINFYIKDLDEGGNKLFFDNKLDPNFSLSITFEPIPVPEPGTLFLMGSGILLLKRFRKKSIEK